MKTQCNVTSNIITEPTALNSDNLYASTSYVNLTRIGNVVKVTGMLNLQTLASNTYEYNVFDNDNSYFKPSANITWDKMVNMNDSSKRVKITIKTNGGCYVTPYTNNTSGYVFLNLSYKV